MVSLVKLWWFFCRNRFDIVHVSTPKAGLLGAIAARLSFHRRIIYTLRGGPYVGATGLTRKMMYTTEWISCHMANRVLPIAHELADQIIEDKLVPRRKVHVIANGSSNGIDLTQYNSSDEIVAQGQAVRDKLGLTDNDLLILCIGRIRREKGINELICAFQQLGDKHDHIHLLLVGVREAVDPLKKRPNKRLPTTLASISLNGKPIPQALMPQPISLPSPPTVKVLATLRSKPVPCTFLSLPRM